VIVRRFSAVETLTADHRRQDFDCGSPAQTQWLRRHALVAHNADTARVYVVRRLSDDLVVGYHALSSGAVDRGSVPNADADKLPRYPIPVILLARLGVDLSEQQQGLGRALLKDALQRTASAANTIGARALLIHAENETARDWYLKQAEFELSQTDELHLLLRMSDLRAVLDA
jgi:GNAT superfamily N-acetyltransferase